MSASRAVVVTARLSSDGEAGPEPSIFLGSAVFSSNSTKGLTLLQETHIELYLIPNKSDREISVPVEYKVSVCLPSTTLYKYLILIPFFYQRPRKTRQVSTPCISHFPSDAVLLR